MIFSTDARGQSQLRRLARQQLPLILPIEPDREDRELHVAAVGLAFAVEDVAHERDPVDDADGLVAQLDRREARFARYQRLDELGLVLDPAARVAIAQL